MRKGNRGEKVDKKTCSVGLQYISSITSSGIDIQAAVQSRLDVCVCKRALAMAAAIPSIQAFKRIYDIARYIMAKVRPRI
jgi:hypothetical protein